MTYKTASDLTKMMLEYLDNLGYEVWRNNNLAVKGRSFIGKKGLPDIIGYHKNYGQFIACEIKAIGDRLSVSQIEFLTHLGMCGGTSIVCIMSLYNINPFFSSAILIFLNKNTLAQSVGSNFNFINKGNNSFLYL